MPVASGCTPLSPARTSLRVWYGHRRDDFSAMQNGHSPPAICKFDGVALKASIILWAFYMRASLKLE